MTRAPRTYPRNDYTARNTYDIGALEQRVYGIEKGQTALAERIDALASGFDGRLDRLASAIEKRSQPQWQAISIFVTISIFLSGGLFAMLSSAQGRLERDIANINADLVREVADIQAQIQTQLVPRAELDDRREIAGQRTERIEADILRLHESTYPREVHLERWAAFTAELNHIREEQQRLSDTLTSISPAGNVLNDLADRIERLESRWIERRMGSEEPGVPLGGR